MATKSIDKKKTLEYAVAFYFYDSGCVNFMMGNIMYQHIKTIYDERADGRGQNTLEVVYNYKKMKYEVLCLTDRKSNSYDWRKRVSQKKNSQRVQPLEIRQRTIRRNFKKVITSRVAIPYTMQHRMKKYYLQGKEISEKQAKAIEAKNQKYISSNDFTLWAKCQFVTVVTK